MKIFNRYTTGAYYIENGKQVALPEGILERNNEIKRIETNELEQEISDIIDWLSINQSSHKDWNAKCIRMSTLEQKLEVINYKPNFSLQGGFSETAIRVIN